MQVAKKFIGVFFLGVWCLAAGAAELGRMQPVSVDNAQAGGGGKSAGLQLALFTPIQVFPESYNIYGLRLNLIYGVNQNLRGLDLGMFNVGRGLMEGVQLGIANRVAGLAGAQIGLLNSADEAEGGAFQLGLFNHANEYAGLQFGPINYAREVNGVQIGVINICETTAGVQIGVINIISQSDFLVFCPLINAQF